MDVDHVATQSLPISLSRPVRGVAGAGRGRGRGRRGGGLLGAVLGAMEVDVLPSAVMSVPDTSLLRLLRVGHALPVGGIEGSTVNRRTPCLWVV